MDSTSSSLLRLLLVAVSVAVPSAEALVVELSSGRSKCLSEELRRGALSVATYRVAAATAEPHISVRVSGSHGETLHSMEGVLEGKFAFEASESGKYSACFWSPRFNPSASVSIDFDWSTATPVIKKSPRPGMAINAASTDHHLSGVMEDLKKLENSIELIHQEMIFLKQSEESTQRLDEANYSRMRFLGGLSLVMCLGVACLQLWHLKAFFQSKKIL